MMTASACFCLNVYPKGACEPSVVQAGDFEELAATLREMGFVLEEFPSNGAYFYTHSDGRFARIFLA